MQGILNYRNIYIKVFGETPMADVEIIFPDKSLGIKPFQLVNLAVTVVTALVTGGLMLWRAGGEKINMNVLWTAASLVLTRCFQVYTNAQNQKMAMSQKISSALYDKMQDSQEGVVSVIMEVRVLACLRECVSLGGVEAVCECVLCPALQPKHNPTTNNNPTTTNTTQQPQPKQTKNKKTKDMADQQLKQMLLAYMVLIIKGRAMDEDALDDACETFLVKDFDHRIDFQISDALPRLLGWGLVREVGGGKLEPAPMDEAIATDPSRIGPRWREYSSSSTRLLPARDRRSAAA